MESKKKPKKKRFSEEVIQDCLRILSSGDIEEMFEILPRLGVVRDERFHQPLLSLLREKDLKKREFAAFALGAISDHRFMDPLKEAFGETEKLSEQSSQELQLAILEAIGAIGDDAAVEFFMPLLQSSVEGRKHSKRLWKMVIESMGAIAQQGGERSIEGLLQLTSDSSMDVRSHALSELSVAYWHRPNEIPEKTLDRIYELTADRHRSVSESALSALQSLADVGCERAERLFSLRKR